MLKGALFFAAAALAAPAAAQSGRAVASTAEIAQAARSCASAISTGHLDLSRLEAEGWGRGSTLGPDGQPLDTPLTIFGRSNVMLMALGAEPEGCVLTARIRSLRDYRDVVDAVGTALGGRVAKEENNSITWILPDNKVANIAATGERRAPSVRIAVGQLPRDRK